MRLLLHLLPHLIGNCSFLSAMGGAGDTPYRPLVVRKVSPGPLKEHGCKNWCVLGIPSSARILVLASSMGSTKQTGTGRRKAKPKEPKEQPQTPRRKRAKRGVRSHTLSGLKRVSKWFHGLVAVLKRVLKWLYGYVAEPKRVPGWFYGFVAVVALMVTVFK